MGMFSHSSVRVLIRVLRSGGISERVIVEEAGALTDTRNTLIAVSEWSRSAVRRSLLLILLNNTLLCDSINSNDRCTRCR